MTLKSKVSLLESLPERRQARFPLGSSRRNMRNAHLCLPFSLVMIFPLSVLALIALLNSFQLLQRYMCLSFHLPHAQRLSFPPQSSNRKSPATIVLDLHHNEAHFSICRSSFTKFRNRRALIKSVHCLFLSSALFNMAILERSVNWLSPPEQ